MPKKSAAARGGAQRQKPRAQKSFELVRPVGAESEAEIETGEQPVENSIATATAMPKDATIEMAEEVPVLPSAKPARETPVRTSAKATRETPVLPGTVATKGSTEATTEAVEKVGVVAARPGSAAERLAARRQNAQRQQRNASSLITAEHFAYVRKDLIFIAILAVIMIGAIITLYFVLGAA